jgi:hypothetical protein
MLQIYVVFRFDAAHRIDASPATTPERKIMQLQLWLRLFSFGLFSENLKNSDIITRVNSAMKMMLLASPAPAPAPHTWL